MIKYLGLAIAFWLAASAYGQFSPGASLPPCWGNVTQLLQICARNNGVALDHIVALMTNGTQKPFPPEMPNYKALRSVLCVKLTPFKTCVRTGYLQATSQCSAQEKEGAKAMTNSVVTAFGNACDGVIVDTTQDPCIQDLNKDIEACYQKNNIDHSYFQMNSTHKKGAIIGETQDDADKFCLARKSIFGCIKTVVDKCPNSETVLALSGYDHIALEKGVEVLCQNDKIYLQGLDCFQTPPAGVKACIQQMGARIQQEAQDELRGGFNKTKYYTNYCRAVAEHVMCDINQWRSYINTDPSAAQVCNKQVLIMKAHFECELIPTPCTTQIIPQEVTNTCKQAEQLITDMVRKGETSSGKHENTGHVMTSQPPIETKIDNTNVVTGAQDNKGTGNGASGVVASTLIVTFSVVLSLL